LLAQTNDPCHTLLVALLKRDAQMLTITLDLEKKPSGTNSTNERGTSLGKEKKTEEKAASLGGFDSIKHKD
jgi:hypothetical protein